jgi:hypothetical protein
VPLSLPPPPPQAANKVVKIAMGKALREKGRGVMVISIFNVAD